MNTPFLISVKRLFLLLLACVLLTFSATAQAPAKWFFIGILEQQDAPPCVNRVNVNPKNVWIKAGDSFESQRKLLVETLKQKLGSGRFWLEQIPVLAGTEYYVAVVKKQRKCSDNGVTKYVPSYGFYGGKSIAAIKEQMDANGKEYKENISQDIVQVIDCRTELSR